MAFQAGVSFRMFKLCEFGGNDAPDHEQICSKDNKRSQPAKNLAVTQALN